MKQLKDISLTGDRMKTLEYIPGSFWGEKIKDRIIRQRKGAKLGLFGVEGWKLGWNLISVKTKGLRFLS